MSDKIGVQSQGVTIVWERKFAQTWFLVKCPEGLTVEEVIIFNETAADGAALFSYNPIENLDEMSMRLDVRPPFSHKLLHKQLRHFLSVRRLLKEPSRKEGMALLRHENEVIRRYALSKVEQWRTGWMTRRCISTSLKESK